MISIVTTHYPFYRKHERTKELSDVCIRSYNEIDRRDETELVIVDAGSKDVWEDRTTHPIYDAIKHTPNLNYVFTNQAIKNNKFWQSKAKNIGVKLSNSEYIFINNMDIRLPKDFVSRYYANVRPMHVWVAHPKNVKKYGDTEGFWRSARGLVGITKKDFYTLNGFDEYYVKNKNDSDFYDRMKLYFKIKEENVEGMYHIDHPGTNERTSQYKGTWE